MEFAGDFLSAGALGDNRLTPGGIAVLGPDGGTPLAGPPDVQPYGEQRAAQRAAAAMRKG